MKSKLIAILVLSFSSAAFADLKSTNRMTVAGQSFNNTVLMKQGKIRNEISVAPGFSTVTIQDCGSHRLIQLNDRTRKYIATDISEGSDQPSTSAASGGALTLNVNQQDTGERKAFFGYTARHIKGAISSQGGSESCSGNIQVATDGWYINLPALDACAPPDREIMRSRLERNGCDDRVILKTTGIQKVGYPVLLDTTIDERGNKISIHQETTDLSPATLDRSLFEIPAGYDEVHSYEELIGSTGVANPGSVQPGELSAGKSPSSTGASQRSASDFGLGTAATPPVGENKKDVLRLGVTQVTSGVATSLATDGWQQELVNDINLLGGQGVALAADPYDRDAALEQGKEQGCDYVIFTKITNFKSASVGEKLGKVFSRGGVGGTGHGRVDISAEVKVFQPDNAVPVLDGSNDFRQTDPDAAWKGLMRVEARDIMLQLKKVQAVK